jgi:xeroderma pigmentosum group C-complementing protein
MVPIRAVTLVRKREVEDQERETGEKPKQGMYHREQTEWIIPPPIVDGVIPKNAYGNMDCFVPSMVPEGAVHIPLRATVRVCKKLGIDYAEAVTGFEFGNKRAVPVCTGVVVAKEHEDLVIDQWEKEEEERRRKEDSKREKAALGMWRKFLMGLRIVERVREEYGEGGEEEEEMNPFTNPNRKKSAVGSAVDTPTNVMGIEDEELEEDMAGGFFVEGHDEEKAKNVFTRQLIDVVEDGKEEEMTKGADEDDGGGERVSDADAHGEEEELHQPTYEFARDSDFESEGESEEETPRPRKGRAASKKTITNAQVQVEAGTPTTSRSTKTTNGSTKPRRGVKIKQPASSAAKTPKTATTGKKSTGKTSPYFATTSTRSTRRRSAAQKASNNLKIRDSEDKGVSEDSASAGSVAEESEEEPPKAKRRMRSSRGR